MIFVVLSGFEGCDLCMMRVNDIQGHLDSPQVIQEATQILQVSNIQWGILGRGVILKGCVPVMRFMTLKDT